MARSMAAFENDLHILCLGLIERVDRGSCNSAVLVIGKERDCCYQG